MHFNQLLEKTNQLNQENLVLKQRLNELEKKEQINVTKIENDIKSKYQQYMQQVNQDQDTIESQHITIQNLEVLTDDLKGQLNMAESLFKHEKGTTKSLQNRLEGQVAANKENLENLRMENHKYTQQVENLLEEKISFVKQIQNSASKIQSLEIENASQRNELEAFKREKSRLETKLREYEDIIAKLKKSLEDLTIEKNGEIQHIKELLSVVERELLKKTADYDILETENYELNQTLSNMIVMSSVNKTEQLEKDLKRSESYLRETREQLKAAEEKVQSLILEKQKEDGSALRNINKKYEEAVQELKCSQQKVDEVLRNYDTVEFENNDLKLKLFEYEQVELHNSSLKEKIKAAAEENKKMVEEMSQLRKNLYNSGKDLLEKNRLAVDQSQTIKSQEQQIKTLEESLATAFEDIKRLHLNFDEKKNDDLAELPPVKKNDEVDVKLREIMIKTKVPIKFIRIGEGLYIFGSKRVHVKILNSKLVIRIGGGYMYVEEFIRLYAHQELAKLKSREEAQSNDSEPEENSLEMRNNQILQQEQEGSVEYLAKELDQGKDTEIRVITNSTMGLNKSPVRRLNTERNASSSYLENRRSSADPKTYLTQDISAQSFTENIVYEIGPKGGHAYIPKGNSHHAKDRTPERPRTLQNEPLPSLRIPEPEYAKRTLSKHQEVSSARDTLSSARIYSRRSIA